LKRQGEGLDLVQEQRPPPCRLQQAGLGAFGIGKRSGFKAKEFRLQQRLRDGRAVDVGERPLGPRAAVVDDPRHQPFARAGLALEEHRGCMRTPDGVEGGQVADLRAEGADRWRTAQETVGRVARGQWVWLCHQDLHTCTRLSDDHSHPRWPGWPRRWLHMAKTGGDWPRDSRRFPRRGQGGRRAGPTDARLDSRWHGDCPGPQPTASGPSLTRSGNIPHRDLQPSERSKGARPMKTKTRVRAGRFTTTHQETVVRDKRRKRSSRPIGSVPYPACSGTTSRGRRNI
jgi:hypothetical protein